MSYAFIPDDALDVGINSQLAIFGGYTESG